MSAPTPAPSFSSATLRARLIEAGLLRPGPKLRKGVLQDFAGRREAAREIFYQSDRVVKHVLGFRYTDQIVRAQLAKLASSTKACATRDKILKERRRWGR